MKSVFLTARLRPHLDRFSLTKINQAVTRLLERLTRDSRIKRQFGTSTGRGGTVSGLADRARRRAIEPSAIDETNIELKFVNTVRNWPKTDTLQHCEYC